MIYEIEQRWQSFLVPELELFIAAGVDESLILFIRYAETIEIDGCDIDEIALDQLGIGIGRPTRGVRLFGELT